ncbi:MAG: hypothetical protein EOM23_03370 [Candidatus Moranbacteria bacterium]|nr:hypothetical protein [Candidatus Moranbacteria bacterium]
MQVTGLSKNIEQSLGQLSLYRQKKLLEFLESLVSEPKTKKQNLLRFAGSIDQADLAMMQQAIADGCEKIE